MGYSPWGHKGLGRTELLRALRHGEATLSPCEHTLETLIPFLGLQYSTEMCACELHHVPLFVTPWTVCSPPGSSVYGIFMQKYWSGLPFPSPGHLPDPGVKVTSPALARGFFTTESPGKPRIPDPLPDSWTQRLFLVLLRQAVL